MAVDNSNTCPSELKSFLSGAGEAFMRPLIALGVAESLTDEVATQLAVLSGLSKREANGLVKSLHFCDFVVERNSEWHFSSQVIECLNAEMACQDELVHKAHSLLLEIAMTGDIKCAGNTIPRYLLSDIGRAYHKSPLSPEEGLKIYASAADKKISGSQWLLGKLAIAQQNKGILPPEAIEPSYIRGMTYYREGQQKEAEYFLGRVVESTEIRVEVAIACHIVGRLLARKRGKRDEAEKLLRRSLLIGEDINHKHHQAQVLHTLGQLIGENRNRSDEAEKLLRRSLDLLKKLKDKHGQAQALHTLGQLIGKNRNRSDEAEKLLRRSLDLLEKLKDKHGQAQALHTLGQLIGKNPNRASEAEELLRKSLKIGEDLGNKHSIAQRLHTLGQLIGKNRNRSDEAEKLLRRSLLIGEDINHKHHQAQALHTLGQLIGKNPNRASEAEELLRKSLKIGEDLGNKHDIAQRLHTLGQLIGKDRNRASEAEGLLRKSLKIGEDLRNKNHQAQVLFSLGKLIWEKNQPDARKMLERSIELNRNVPWARDMVQRELNKRLKSKKG